MNWIKYIALLGVFIFSSAIYAQNDSLVEEPAVVMLADTLYIPSSSVISKQSADSAYINNDFVGAAELYELLLMDGESSDVYYNLGNSYYKSNEIARAILNYERALLLDPGNADIRFNLEMARAKAIDKVEETPEIFFVSWTKSLINMQSADNWGVCAIVFFIILIVAAYFFIFSKNVMIKKIGFFSGLLCICIVVLANVFAAQQKRSLVDRSSAIIMQPSVTVRSTPSESGTGLFVLHEGRKVDVKDNSMIGWKEIRLEDGKVGWVPAAAIEVI